MKSYVSISFLIAASIISLAGVRAEAKVVELTLNLEATESMIGQTVDDSGNQGEIMIRELLVDPFSLAEGDIVRVHVNFADPVKLTQLPGNGYRTIGEVTGAETVEMALWFLGQQESGGKVLSKTTLNVVEGDALLEINEIEIASGGSALGVSFFAANLTDSYIVIDGFSIESQITVLDSDEITIGFISFSLDASDISIVTGPMGYGGGEGTESDPYIIAAAEQLQQIGLYPEDWGKHFILADNIDLTAYNDENGWPNFNRIGTYENPFTGVFDGNGYSVTGLFFSSEDVDDVGMFGCIGEVGVVRDLDIVEAGIDAVGGINVGIIAGINEGTVENCTAGGMVLGNYATGGLVGLNLDYAAITGCDCSAEVTGTFSLTGGIAGGNYGMLQNSSSAALVTGQSKVGSIAGYNDLGVIENCYSHVGPEGISEVGGLAGRNYEGVITNSYSTGIPLGDFYVGALIGKDINGLGTFAGCFYDIDIDPNLLGTGSAEIDPDGIIGETTGNLKLASTYTGWDTTVWALRDNDDYPKLSRQLLQCDIAGSWGVNLADFQVLASNWQKTGLTQENARENADFDESGTVGLEDLTILSQAWLIEK